MASSRILAASSSGLTREAKMASIGFITGAIRFVANSQTTRVVYSTTARIPTIPARRTDDATGRAARTTKYMRKIGDLSASTPDSAIAYAPMIAVTAVTSMTAFASESQSGRAGLLYHRMYWPTVHRSVGMRSSTFVRLSSGERLGA